jgi:hypothetical protein
MAADTKEKGTLSLSRTARLLRSKRWQVLGSRTTVFDSLSHGRFWYDMPKRLPLRSSAPSFANCAQAYTNVYGADIGRRFGAKKIGKMGALFRLESGAV